MFLLVWILHLSILPLAAHAIVTEPITPSTSTEINISNFNSVLSHFGTPASPRSCHNPTDEILVENHSEKNCRPLNSLLNTLENEAKHKIARALLNELSKIQENNKVHRDIKPENITVCHNTLTNDYHINIKGGFWAQLGEADNGAGTPYYLNPASCRGEPLTLDRDNWAMALTLYALYSGKPISKHIRMKRSVTQEQRLSNLLGEIRDIRSPQAIDRLFGTDCSSQLYTQSEDLGSKILTDVICPLLSPNLSAQNAHSALQALNHTLMNSSQTTSETIAVDRRQYAKDLIQKKFEKIDHLYRTKNNKTESQINPNCNVEEIVDYIQYHKKNRVPYEVYRNKRQQAGESLASTNPHFPPCDLKLTSQGINLFPVSSDYDQGSFKTIQVGFNYNTNRLIVKQTIKTDKLSSSESETIAGKPTEHHIRTEIMNSEKYGLAYYEKTDKGLPKDPNGNIVLTQEYCESNLKSQLGKIDRETQFRFAKEILTTLSKIQRDHQVHRDIKPENILLCYDERDRKLHAKISDFGLMIPAGGEISDLAGTPYYMSPTSFIPGPPSFQADNWAIGLTLHELFSGESLPPRLRKLRKGQPFGNFIRQAISADGIKEIFGIDCLPTKSPTDAHNDQNSTVKTIICPLLQKRYDNEIVESVIKQLKSRDFSSNAQSTMSSQDTVPRQARLDSGSPVSTGRLSSSESLDQLKTLAQESIEKIKKVYKKAIELGCDTNKLDTFLQKNRATLMREKYYSANTYLNPSVPLDSEKVPCDLQMGPENEIMVFPTSTLFDKGASKKVYIGFDYDTGRLMTKQIMSIPQIAEKRELFFKDMRKEESFSSAAGLPYKTKIENGHELILTQKFCEGNLVAMRNDLSMEEKIKFTKEFLEQLDKFHKAGNVHRDIKPQNILICRGDDGKRHAVISDYGLATTTELTPDTLATKNFGTICYMPPDMANSDLMSSKNIAFLPSRDNWAAGLVLFWLYSGIQPPRCDIPVFLTLSKMKTPLNVDQFHGTKCNETEIHRSFGESCNPTQYCKKVYSVICSLLNTDYTARISAEAALNSLQ